VVVFARTFVLPAFHINVRGGQDEKKVRTISEKLTPESSAEQN
jgi:hypothetical protein